MRESPILSVIIVNWNTRALLAQCLRTLFAESGDLGMEVFVVDNGSKDGSAAMVKETFPRVHLIENNRNFGFAGANNQAITRCHGKYILLLNSDTIVLPRALQTMVDCLGRFPELGALGAYLLNADRTPQRCYGAFPSLLSEGLTLLGFDKRHSRLMSRWTGLNVDRGMLTSGVLDVDWVVGASLAIRRAALEKVGVLDEGFFWCSEDTDWCYRFRKAGWKVGLALQAQIVHLGGASSDLASDQMVPELLRSKIKYFEKHQGRAVALAYRILVASVALLKVAWFGLFSLISPSRRRELTVWTGVLKGV